MNESAFENKVLPWIGTLWFLVAIDSFFLWWDFSSRIIRIIAFLSMLYASLKLSKKCKATTYNLPIFLSLLLYVFWLLGFFTNNTFVLINKIFGFAPLLLLLFWPKDVFNKWYVVLRKVIIFFAIGSSVVSILSLVGVLDYLPHFTFEARSELHKSRGFVYHVYGAFVTIPVAGLNSRACGPVQEPGHWAVFLGLFYLIDWYALRKRNIWFLIGGLFTFSSAFWVMFLSVEILNLFSRSTFRKTISFFSVIIVAVFFIFLVMPQNVKDEIYYLFFERNLEKVYEGYEETGSLENALDERAANYSIERYYNLSLNDYLFGTGYRDNTVVISDYRGTIMFIGLIGLILSIIPVLFTIRKAKWRLALSLIVSLFLIYIHRGWMFYTPYIYFLAFLAVRLSSVPIPEYSQYLVEKIEDSINANVVLEHT